MTKEIHAADRLYNNYSRQLQIVEDEFESKIRFYKGMGRAHKTFNEEKLATIKKANKFLKGRLRNEIEFYKKYL